MNGKMKLEEYWTSPPELAGTLKDVMHLPQADSLARIMKRFSHRLIFAGHNEAFFDCGMYIQILTEE